MTETTKVAWLNRAEGMVIGSLAVLLATMLTGCSIQGGTKKGGGWLLEWQPPKVEIDNGGRPLLIDFGRVMWADWPSPEAVPVEPGPTKA